PAGTFIPSSGISAMSKDLKFPTTWKSSLAVDVKLPWGIVATVEGIYNRDLNAVAARNVNLVAPTALNVAGYPDNRPIFPNANVDKYINKLNSAGIPGSGTTGFNTTVMYNDKGGHYASGMLQLTKNFQNGFSGSVSYVAAAAKNFGDGSGDQIINLWS